LVKVEELGWAMYRAAIAIFGDGIETEGDW
jgi:hypothetical protein